MDIPLVEDRNKVDVGDLNFVNQVFGSMDFRYKFIVTNFCT